MGILNFADLKNNGHNSIDKLNEEASKFNSGGFTRDERYWDIEKDKAGDGSAIIRFLPAPPNEDIPFIRRFSYGFKGPTGKWFIENSPTTIGRPCPVAELNSQLYESGSEEKKEQAKQQKRRLNYIANVYVVKHKARPSDEGKVFLFRFGKKIWDKLQDKMNPDDDDKKPMNPFDLWKGANFRLKVSKVSGFPNYDKSEFDDVSALSPDDSELERIWRMSHSLQGELAESNFKSYDELKRKLDSVLSGGGEPARRAVEESEGRVTNRREEDDTPPWEGGSTSGDSDSSLDWLRNMANGTDE